MRSTVTQLINRKDLFLWLSRGELKAETESKTTAAQDQALRAKYHTLKILQMERDRKCRL
jgi:hypothetical protein